MRSTIAKFEGVTISDLKKGNRDFKINYDPNKCKPDDIIAALKEEGEGAKIN